MRSIDSIAHLWTVRFFRRSSGSRFPRFSVREREEGRECEGFGMKRGWEKGGGEGGIVARAKRKEEGMRRSAMDSRVCEHLRFFFSLCEGRSEGKREWWWPT
ncbi:hypothetical protein MRB53_002711 [Persea americana]|uniref:Uncharacterized protein n=1 Tax=Persea americana TaxID=3435 RepID=A0ACC2MVM6_PERAE|nr:hypothetical protein MRB53_002711 [Persea americana]